MAVEKVLRVLPRGSHFGEVALVTNARRGCNVRTRAFCEIQILKRTVFDAIMERYPEEKRVIKALLLQKCNKQDEEAKHTPDIRLATGDESSSPEQLLQEMSARLAALESALTFHLKAK